MGSYVFRRDGDGRGAILHFDGLQLLELKPDDEWTDFGRWPPDWGRAGRGSRVTAALLARHQGAGATMLEPLADLLYQEFVRLLKTDSHTVPEWVVSQEVLRLAMRVCADWVRASAERSSNV